MALALDTIAQRYALALLDLAMSINGEQKIAENVQEFAQILESAPDLKRSLIHPNVKIHDKQAILSIILERAHFERYFNNFVRLLVDRGRVALFPRIAMAYAKHLDESKGRERVIVVSAQALTDAQREALKNRILMQHGLSPVLEERIDEKVLGGLRVEIRGKVYDSTVKGHLERLRKEIAES